MQRCLPPLGPASLGGRHLGCQPRGLCGVTESRSLAENKLPCVPAYPQMSEGLGTARFNFFLSDVQFDALRAVAFNMLSYHDEGCP